MTERPVADRASPSRREGPGGFGGARLWREWWALLLLMSMLLAASLSLGGATRADNLVYDMVQRWQARSPGDRVLIVAIDDQSLRRLGRWPWPRAVHARLLDRLAAARPAAVGYDVLFLEPGADDAALAAAMRRVPTVLPVAIEVPGLNGASSSTTLPVPAIAQAATALAQVVMRPDRDGVVRRTGWLEDATGRRWPAMTDQLTALARGAPPIPMPPPHGALIETRGLPIAFAAGPARFPQVAFVDALDGRVPAALLRDRIVLVGATAAGLGDRFSTPLSGDRDTMPGIEVQANQLDAMLTGNRIRDAGLAALLLFTLVPLWLMMLAFARLSPRGSALVGAGLMLAAFGVSVGLLWGAGLWLPPVTAIAGLVLVYPLWGWRRLDIASRFMIDELQQLSVERQLERVDETPGSVAGDAVARQIGLMRAAIDDVRDLRRFVTQSLDSLPDAALVTSPDGVVRLANAAAERLLHARMDGAPIGLPLRHAFAALGQSGPEAAALLDAVEAGRRPPLDGYETRLDDGATLEIRLAFFTDDRRSPLGWIVRLADITALRASERQREDALRLLTHDMRAPQASILALLQTDGGGVEPEMVTRIGRYARQTLDLADDYVNLARAESGNYAVEPINIADALLDAADDLWPLSQAKAIEVRCDVPDDEVMVRGNRALLARMLGNLIGNAIKYSPASTRIDCRLSSDDGMATCVIADQGAGIAAADLPLLFQAFRRVGEADAGDGPSGAGLGLAFVKAVAERHGGRVAATSVLGNGSEFSVTLPLLDD